MPKTDLTRQTTPSPAATGTTKRYDGMIAVTITPCRQPGQIDPPAMTRLCRTLSNRGCQGLFVVGSTGEMPLLDEDDRRALIAAAREGTEADVVLYAGISGTGLRQTIRYAHAAAAEGADVAVLMAPMIFKFSQEELLAYVHAVADASPLPVALYHHLRMPTAFAVETVVRLAEHPNLVAIKDTSLDMDRLRQLVAATRDHRLAVMQGCEAMAHESLQSGAAGCVLALGSVVPEWSSGLWQAHLAGDAAKAAHYQEQILKLCKLFEHAAIQRSLGYFTYLLRRILQLRGWLNSTAGMMPGLVPDPDFDRAIEEVVRAAGLEGGDGTLG